MQTQPITTGPIFYVRSSTNTTRFYLVAENPGGFLECECKAAQFCRTKPCKHVEQVRRGCGLAARPKARTATGKGREDAGCERHTDCGYETAEHIGRGPYGDGWPTRPAPRTVTTSAAGRELVDLLQV